MSDSIQTSTNEARLLGDDNFLRRVAQLYYEDGNSQETVAEMVFCSRQTVGKALQKAKERKIIRTSVVPDERTGYLRNLARDVRLKLHLEDLILVSGHGIDRTEIGQPREDVADDVIAEITRAAYEYLDQMLSDNDILAVSGGKRFMRNLIRYAKPVKPREHLRVISTIGFASAHTSFGDGNLIAYDLASMYGADHTWFPCPAFLHNAEQLKLVRQLPLVKDAYELMQQATIVVTGLWRPEFDEIVKLGFLTQEKRDQLESYYPVADINHWLFDASGQCINRLFDPEPYFLSGMEIPDLKDKVQNNRTRVMLIAGGDTSYAPAIQATIKAGIVSILATDHITAHALLELE